VVNAVLRLIRFRNTHPAFAGDFEAEYGPDGALELRWRHGDARARLKLALRSPETGGHSWRLDHSSGGGATVLADTDLLAAS
jgi:hypothetical protein